MPTSLVHLFNFFIFQQFHYQRQTERIGLFIENSCELGLFLGTQHVYTNHMHLSVYFPPKLFQSFLEYSSNSIARRACDKYEVLGEALQDLSEK